MQLSIVINTLNRFSSVFVVTNNNKLIAYRDKGINTLDAVLDKMVVSMDIKSNKLFVVVA